MVELPEPEICHSLLGLPGLVFSHAISLTTGASQGAAAASVAGIATSRTMPKLKASAALSSRREKRARPNEAREDTPRHHPSGRAATRLQRGCVSFAPGTQPTKSLRVLPPQSRGESTTVSGFRVDTTKMSKADLSDRYDRCSPAIVDNDPAQVSCRQRLML